MILYKELYYDTTAHLTGQNFGNHNKNLCELKPIDWKWREKIHSSKMANCYAMSYPIIPTGLLLKNGSPKKLL